MPLDSSALTPLFPAAFANASKQISPGVYAPGSLPDFLASPDNPNAYLNKVIPLGSANGARKRGANIRLLGGPSSSDGGVISVAVSLLRACSSGPNSSSPTGFEIEPLGSLGLVLGTTTVAANLGYGPEATRIADTAVWTADGLCAHYAAAYGSAPAAYSPTDETQAVLTIPDAFGAFGIILEPIGVVAFNAVYELIT